MKKRGSRIVMGTAIGAAAIAVATDHTGHRLPEPQAKQSDDNVVIVTEGEEQSANPSSLGDDNVNPCAVGGSSPCSL